MVAVLKSLIGALVLAGAAQTALAADVTLRLHQFLPPQATIPAKAIAPWAAKVEKDSGGRIKVQQFPSMQLGGKPTDLFDQSKDGVVDIVWTVLGYTPGRFPKSEVFELPFSVGSAEAGSRAFQAYVEKNAMDEFKDVKLIAVHVHGPGLFHSQEPINKLDDLKGMKVRGGSRVINIMLEQLGATPVGMPVPAVGEALSKGVISATTIPWEVVPALKVQQIVKNHTGFTGDKGLYTQTFGVVMNKASYDKLPPDLKKVIDANSGSEVAALFGRAMDEGDKVGLSLAQKAGNRIITLDAAETARWQRTAASFGPSMPLSATSLYQAARTPAALPRRLRHCRHHRPAVAVAIRNACHLGVAPVRHTALVALRLRAVLPAQLAVGVHNGSKNGIQENAATMTDLGAMTMTEIVRLQSQLQQELTRRFEHQRLLVFSDIVGSTAYFARFGDAAGRQLQQLHCDLLEQSLVPAEGRIVDTAGDGAFAVYPMAEAAVPSLIAFQQALASANAARGRLHQLQVRIGMHWGPVLTDGMAVSGDAVNLCARVASSAEAGEIRLTRDVFQELSRAHRLICRGLGPVALKGVAQTLELLALEWRDPATFPRRLRIIESREERDLPQQDIISFGRLLEHEGVRANDIALAHPDPELTRQISRWHFELRRTPDGLRLRTLSDSATEVDGQRLGKGADVVVRSGSRIRVADVLTLSLMGTQRPAPDKDPDSTLLARPATPPPGLGDAPTWGPGALVDRAAGTR